MAFMYEEGAHVCVEHLRIPLFVRHEEEKENPESTDGGREDEIFEVLWDEKRGCGAGRYESS